MKNYFNTTNLIGEELKREILKAKTQNDVVYAILKKVGKPLTPYEVHDLSGLNCPITSIRRSMTVLTNQGLLKQTEILKEGKYGKKNYTWKVN